MSLFFYSVGARVYGVLLSGFDRRNGSVQTDQPTGNSKANDCKHIRLRKLFDVIFIKLEVLKTKTIFDFELGWD